MTIGEYTERFYGKPIANYEPGKTVGKPQDVAYRIAVEYDADTSASQLLKQLFSEVPVEQIEALVIGAWNEPYEESPQDVLETLIAHAAQLTSLRALFVGDMTFEDCEISWIKQASYKPLLDAFPVLEALTIRGSTDLVIEPFQHAKLRELTIQTGGLPTDIVSNIAASDLPALTHLELWLGSDGYGFDGDAGTYVNAMTSIVSKSPLCYLGLRNAEIADELAQALAKQAWVGQLETLDLSLGTLGDKGAQPLLDSPYVRTLKKLNLERHYISDALQDKLRQLPLEVDLSDAQGDDEDPYVSVSE